MNPIPSFILTELEKIKGAEAILLTGSRALGKETKNSDWDFMIILKEGSPRWRKTWKMKDTWIELMCNDRKQIEKEFKEDLEEGRGVTTYMFATGMIVKDNSTKVLQALTLHAKENWTKGPTKLKQDKINWIDYDISTYLQDIEDCLHENNPALLMINHAVNEFVNYYFRLGNIWLTRPKERMNDLKKRAPHLYKCILKINTTNNWKAKAKLAIALGVFVGKKYKLKLSGELEVPPSKE